MYNYQSDNQLVIFDPLQPPDCQPDSITSIQWIASLGQLLSIIREPAWLDCTQAAEASPAHLSSASREPDQVDLLLPAERQPGSIVFCSSRTTPVRSYPVGLHPPAPSVVQVYIKVKIQAHLIEMVKVVSRSIISSQVKTCPYRLLYFHSQF
jgi:hypothetical protein